MTAAPKTKTYGDTDPALTYSVTKGTLAAGDSLSGTLSRAAGQDVGSYRIEQGTLTAGSNYALTFEPAALEVTPRSIGVTADPQSKVYGDADPTLSYTVSGSLANDDKLSGALDRANGQAVGAYAIGQGTLTAGKNYVLTYKSANLTVTARPLTVTADSGVQGVRRGRPGPHVRGHQRLPRLRRQAQAVRPRPGLNGQGVGTYAIGRGDLTPGANYDLTYRGADFTVTARPLTVTADPQSKVYGYTDPRAHLQAE